MSYTDRCHTKTVKIKKYKTTANKQAAIKRGVLAKSITAIKLVLKVSCEVGLETHTLLSCHLQVTLDILQTPTTNTHLKERLNKTRIYSFNKNSLENKFVLRQYVGSQKAALSHTHIRTHTHILGGGDIKQISFNRTENTHSQIQECGFDLQDKESGMINIFITHQFKLVVTVVVVSKF